MIQSFHQPSHFLFLFPFIVVLRARPHSQRIPPAPESGLHSVHRTLFFIVSLLCIPLLLLFSLICLFLDRVSPYPVPITIPHVFSRYSCFLFAEGNQLSRIQRGNFLTTSFSISCNLFVGGKVDELQSRCFVANSVDQMYRK